MPDNNEPLKATLKIILMAGDVTVAESTNPVLWQGMLREITGGGVPISSLSSTLSLPASPSINPSWPSSAALSVIPGPGPAEPLGRMAEELHVGVNELIGACDPELNAPFLTLDAHCWEAMKRSVPSKGTKALSGVALAGTLLAVWSYYAGLGPMTTTAAQTILGGIGVRDANPARAIRNASWLLNRSTGFLVNPAQLSRALLITRCFVLRDWSDYRG